MRPELFWCQRWPLAGSFSPGYLFMHQLSVVEGEVGRHPATHGNLETYATLPDTVLTSKLGESTDPLHYVFYLKTGQRSCRIRTPISNSMTRDKSTTLSIRVCFQEWEGSDFWCRWKSASPWSTMMALSHNYFLVSIISHANPISAKI